MTEDIEERFRVACTTYLACAEEADRRRALLQAAAAALQEADRLADHARDQLLQVVRERDAAAQLAAAGPPVGVSAVLGPDGRDTGATIIGGRIIPSARAAAARDEFFARYGITITRGTGHNTGDAVQEYDDQGRPVITDD